MFETAAILDVETTGFSPFADEIVELAIALVRYDLTSGRIIETISQYSGLREPWCAMHRSATAIHGITRAMVRGLELDYSQIRTIFKRADFIIAHNAAFDRSFVERLIPLSRRKKWLCSLNGIDWQSKGFECRRLENLTAAHKIAYRRAHRADADVEMLVALLSYRAGRRKTYFYELLRGAGFR